MRRFKNKYFIIACLSICLAICSFMLIKTNNISVNADSSTERVVTGVAFSPLEGDYPTGVVLHIAFDCKNTTAVTTNIENDTNNIRTKVKINGKTIADWNDWVNDHGTGTAIFAGIHDTRVGEYNKAIEILLNGRKAELTDITVTVEKGLTFEGKETTKDYTFVMQEDRSFLSADQTLEITSIVKSNFWSAVKPDETGIVINTNKPNPKQTWTDNLAESFTTNAKTHILLNGVPFGELNNWVDNHAHGTGMYVGSNNENFIPGNYENGLELFIGGRQYQTCLIQIKKGFQLNGVATASDAYFKRNTDGTFEKYEMSETPEVIYVNRMPYSDSAWFICYIGFNTPYDGLLTGAAGTSIGELQAGVTINGNNVYAEGGGGG